MDEAARDVLHWDKTGDGCLRGTGDGEDEDRPAAEPVRHMAEAEPRQALRRRVGALQRAHRRAHVEVVHAEDLGAHRREERRVRLQGDRRGGADGAAAEKVPRPLRRRRRVAQRLPSARLAGLSSTQSKLSSIVHWSS